MRYGFNRKRTAGASSSERVFGQLAMAVFYGFIIIFLLKLTTPWEKMFFSQGQRCMNYWNKDGRLEQSYSPPYGPYVIYIRYQIEPNQGRRSPENFYHVCVFDGWSVDPPATKVLIERNVQTYLQRCELVSQQLKSRGGRGKRWDPQYDSTPERKAAWRAAHCTAEKGREKAERHPEILFGRDRGNGEFD